MKPIPYILLLAAIVSLTSCRKRIEGSGHFVTTERQVPAFNEVESDGSFNVIIKQDSFQRVTIHGEDNILPHITTRVESKRLRIYFDDDWYKKYKYHGLTVYINVQKLTNVALTGSGSIRSDGTIKGEALAATLTGSGEMEFTVESSMTQGYISGSGNISLHGKSTGGVYNISGSGNVRAFDCLSDNVNVTISGSGDAEVHAEKTLKVNISGSGDVKYIGHPTVQSSISGSGSVGPL